MLNDKSRNVMTRLGTALLLCSTLALAACATAANEEWVDPRRTSVSDRFPITVKDAPVKLGIAAHTGTLQPEQINEVANFARDARDNASSTVVIRYPSASARMRQVAMDIGSLMVDQGVPQQMIRVGTYSGSAYAPVQITFERKVAVTKECGDWSRNLANDMSNQSYPDHGCSFQNNIAAMVSDPNDFLYPRASAPIPSPNRTAAIAIYYKSPTVITSSSATNATLTTTINSSSSSSGGGG
jgi:pilus assembly protein CpaD